jgi:hypothetical protein
LETTNESKISWVIMRDLKPICLKAFDSDLSILQTMDCSEITHAFFSGDLPFTESTLELLLKRFNTFSKLTKLTSDNAILISDNFFNGCDEIVLRNLKELDLELWMYASNVSIEKLTVCCFNIVSLSIDVSDLESFSETVILQLCQQNRNLKKIRFRSFGSYDLFSTSFITSIVSTCNAIVDLHFCRIIQFNLIAIAEILSSVKSNCLKNIEIVESDEIRYLFPQVIYNSTEFITEITIGGDAFSFESISVFFSKENNFTCVLFKRVSCLSIPLIIYIINVCSELKSVYLQACENITKESISDMRKSVRNTVIVGISY